MSLSYTFLPGSKSRSRVFCVQCIEGDDETQTKNPNSFQGFSLLDQTIMIQFLGMADEENRDRIRRMDLNLYLGLPRRLPEPDLGSDLALGSLPVFEEMSSSQTESNPSVAQSTQQQQEAPIEYNPYSPSYGHVSLPEQTSLEEEEEQTTLVHNVYDDPFVNPPYSTSFVQASPPTVQDSTEAMVHEGSNSNDVEYVPYSLSSYAPVSLSPPPQSNESLAQQEHTHAPYIPASATNLAQDDHLTGESIPETTIGFGPYQDDRPRRRLLVRDNSAQRLLLQYPEVRFRRLIDSNLRLRIRRFRSSVPYEAVADPDPELNDDLPDTGGAFRDRDTTVSETSPETNFVNQKASFENHGTQDLEEKGSEDIKSGAANFDCNVCLDIAKEPVVTSCGHLFCWPCLYQWLHLHSDHKECPVCKGEVTDSNVTPIYGRGSSEMGIEKKLGEAEDSSLKIPPRPHGRRLESFRQQLRRPLGSWRLVVDEDIHNRAEGQEEPSVFTGSNGRMLTRLRAARRFPRDESLEQSTNVAGSGSSRHNHELNLNRPEVGNTLPEAPSSALNRRGFGFWSRFAFYSVPSSERLAAIAADLSNAVGRGRMATSGNSSGASGSVNPRDSDHHLNVQGNQEPLVTGEQASASSTVAMIQGDTGGTIDAPAEPSSVGSSRTLRRRRRNSVSGSLDADGGVQHASKRRRLN